jgi:hypothetical protein
MSRPLDDLVAECPGERVGAHHDGAIVAESSPADRFGDCGRQLDLASRRVQTSLSAAAITPMHRVWRAGGTARPDRRPSSTAARAPHRRPAGCHIEPDRDPAAHT